MSKVKVDLETAKKILNTDKVFLNGKNKFNVFDGGKYNSGFTIVIPQEWDLNVDEKPENPINYKECKELTDGMNVDFDGEASILLGKYRKSQNGKPVFEITEPIDAKDTLISVSWGGSFNHTQGQSGEYAKEVGAKAFVRCSSNGGGLGTDYWVLPVDFVKDMGKRDVSSILEKLQKEKEENIARIDNIIEEKRRAIKESRENKDRIIKDTRALVDEIREYTPDFKFDTQEDHVICDGTKMLYNDSVISELDSILKNEKEIKATQDKFMPMFKKMEGTIKDISGDIEFRKTDIIVKYKTDSPYSDFQTYYYKYSESDYNKFVDEMDERVQMIENKRIETQRKEEEIKQKVKLEKLKKEAKEKGYPEKYSHFNRLSGKTGLSHAYVIDENGSVREPDDNILVNKNHVYKTQDWKNCCDGTQIYDQIYQKEVIVSYSKEDSSTPYVLEVEWTDGQVNEGQKEVICDLLNLKEDGSLVDKNSKNIDSIRDWLEKELEEKSIECKKQLKSEDSIKKDTVESIEEYERQAEQLLKKYNLLLEKIEAAKKLEKDVEKANIDLENRDLGE